MPNITPNVLLGAVAKLLAVVLIVGVVNACDGSTSGDSSDPRRSDGPVSFPGSRVHQRAGWTGGPDARVVFGATVVVNTGGSEATVDGIRLVGDVSPDAAEVAETRLVDLGPAPGRGDLVGTTAFPLDEPFLKKWWKRSLPAQEATLAANTAAELVFVVEVHRDGDWYWPQTAVDYQLDGVQYTASTNFGFQACSLNPKDCAPVK